MIITIASDANKCLNKLTNLATTQVFAGNFSEENVHEVANFVQRHKIGICIGKIHTTDYSNEK